MNRGRFILVLAIVSGIFTASSFAKEIQPVFKDNGQLRKGIGEGKSIMFIGPHPDDEASIAGTIALAAGEKGSSVYVLCFGSMENVRRANVDIPSRLKAIRWISGKYLKDYLFLDEDFTVITPKVAADIKPRLIRKLEDIKPDIVITFSPAGYYGHQNHRVASKIITEACGQLSYKPQVYFVINTDQELNVKSREYRKYPPTDIVGLDDYSEKLGKTLWLAKLEIWNHYSDSVPVIMGAMARTKQLEKNDHKEYFLRVK
jgi:LmbE family N-acetylglucosaminyl deacetylase